MRCLTEQKDTNHARRFSKAARIQTVEKTFQSKDYGKEDSVKETHQGCLSRSINQFFKLFKSLKNCRSVSK